MGWAKRCPCQVEASPVLISFFPFNFDDFDVSGKLCCDYPVCTYVPNKRRSVYNKVHNHLLTTDQKRSRKIKEIIGLTL